MKAIKIILLVLGIILLVIGVYKQDGTLMGLIVAMNVISRSEGAPSWQDVNASREVVLENDQTGMIFNMPEIIRVFFDRTQ